MDIVVINTDQQYLSAMQTALAQVGVAANIRYAEDAETLISAIKKGIPDVVFFQKSYDIQVPRIHQLLSDISQSPSLLVEYQANAQWDSVEPTSLKYQLVSLGVSDFILQHDYHHFAAIIVREAKHSALMHKYLKIARELDSSAVREDGLRQSNTKAVAMIKDGVHAHANDTYLKFFNLNKNDLLTTPVLDLLQDKVAFKQNLKLINKGTMPLIQFKCTILHDEQPFITHLKLSPVQYEGEKCIQMVFDIPQSNNTQVMNAVQIPASQSAESVQVKAHIDAHTGIPNKIALMHHLEKTVDLVSSSDTLSSHIIVISSDEINDLITRFGFSVEQTIKHNLIKHVQSFLAHSAATLTPELYEINDALHAIAIQNISQTELSVLIEQLLANLAQVNINHNGNNIKLQCSAGICTINHFDSADELLLHAMQTNKLAQSSDSKLCIYTPPHNAEGGKKALRDEIIYAIKSNSLSLQFQHLYDTQNDTQQFVESFVRLKRANGELLSPAQFLPAAKQFKLVEAIDQWVVLNVCRQFQPLLQKHPSAKVLINASAHSLQTNALGALLAKVISAIGQQYASQIYIQFSEVDLINHLQYAKESLDQLAKLGVGLSISSFGQTSESLALLQQVQVNLVKLDASLTENMHIEKSQEELAQLIQAINAHNVQCIIGFVDNPQGMSSGWSVGARFLQGFFLDTLKDRITAREIS